MKHSFTFLFLIFLIFDVKVSATPIITSFSPTIGTFRNAITINGSGFSNVYLENYGDAVLFGGQAADSLTIVSDNQIIAWVGVGSSGSVTVEDKNGSSGSMAGFTYVAPTLPNNLQWQLYGTLGPSNSASYVSGVWSRHDAKPIIAYRDAASKYAYAAEFSKQTNQMTLLGGPISAGDCSGIKIIEDANATDYPVVAYYDPAINVGINVKHFNGTSWVPVGGSALSGQVYSMAVDNNSNLYLLAFGAGTGMIVYRCNIATNSPWSVVGSANFARSNYGFMNIAIDKRSNTPYVVFDDGSQQISPTSAWGGSVMKFNGTSWVYVGKPGFSLGSTGIFSADVAIDPQGNPICSFQDDNGFQRANVFKFSNGIWSPLGYPNFSNSTVYPVYIALDANGKPYVCFNDYSYNNKGTIMTYNNATNNWNIVGARGFLDIRNALQRGSIFVDGYDNPWIACPFGYSLGYSSPTFLEYQSNDSTILPAKLNTQVANRQSADTAGWMHYYYDNGTADDFRDDILLLSLKTSENIGNIGDGTFSVRSVATAGAGSNTGIKLTNPLITNATGYWVMNRFWQVTPTREPTNSVGVRFYYNNQDLADVNGSYPNHNLTNQDLIFYKSVDGDPDPTNNLNGATKVIPILAGTHASDTTWTYHALSDTTQYGEYSVSSFSGGGGGGTGNGMSILPVTFISFSGHLSPANPVLDWQTTNEVNVLYFNIQRSIDGVHFTTVGKEDATGNRISSINNYRYTDAVPSATATYYYRIQAVDKDGKYSYTNIVALDLAGKNHLTIFPNPVKDVLFAQIQNDKQGPVNILITDQSGKILQELQMTLNAGASNFSIIYLPWQRVPIYWWYAVMNLGQGCS